MKKLILLFIISISVASYGQEIENLTVGIRTTKLPDKYVSENHESTSFKMVTSNDDSIVFEYFISNFDKDNVINIFFSGTAYMVKAIAINDKSGFLIIDKKKLIPGRYKIILFSAGKNMANTSFANEKYSEMKKQIGNYIYYFKDGLLMFKYIGIE
jgi:hypothetical protein